ncbi:MAG: hypothetical protein AAF544_01460 [Bacteroidota bacterium]
MKHNLFIITLVLFALTSCGSNADATQQEEQTQQPQTQTETRRESLEGTRVSFELPITYERSRAYLLEDAIEGYKAEFHAIFDDLLLRLEREDEEADIFVDGEDNFDHFQVRIVSKLDLSEDRATLYAANLEQVVQERAEKTRGLESERLSTTLNEGNGKTMLKLKYRHESNRAPKEFFESIYFISDAVQSFVITEYHRDEADLERMYWRMTY